jgi:hypothetical protein
MLMALDTARSERKSAQPPEAHVLLHVSLLQAALSISPEYWPLVVSEK